MAVENILQAAKTAFIEFPMRLKLFSRKRSVPETRNEQATFEALIEGCWDALWRYAYHTTGNAEEAEDLLSETLLEGFPQFRAVSRRYGLCALDVPRDDHDAH